MKSAFLAVALIAGVALPTWAAEPIQVVNIMRPFFAAWTERPMPIGGRIKALKENVIYPNGPLYDQNFFALDDPHIAWYLSAVGHRVTKMRALQSGLERRLPQLEAAFEGAFPKFDPNTVRIYLMPSMNTFDGMTKDINGKHGLLIGIDALANENLNLGVFIDHEMFHIYHHEINPSFFASARGEDDLYRFGLYRQLWAEGLATYVSQRLNPTASDADALASATLANLSEAGTKKLACLAHDNLDSTQDGYSALLFDAVTHPKGLPPRGGYLIGYLVAKQLSQKMTMADLSELSGDDLRMQVETVTALLCHA